MSLFKAAKRKSAEKPGENKSTPRYVPLKYAIMTSFLMLVIPGLVILSFFSYSDTRNDMENAYSQLQDQTKNTVFNAIKLVDAGYQVLENFLNKKMKKGFARFDEAYEKTGRDAAKIDLKALKEHLGGKMDLYMINADGVVEYTTYTKDLNLDFKSKSPKFYQELTAIREKNEFVSGGMTAEARTGRVRKYAYMPTADNRYVMELGLVSDEFKKLLGDLDLVKITEQLRVLSPALESVRIFTRNGHLLGNPQAKPDSVTKAIVADIYKNKIPYDIPDYENSLQVHYFYAGLPPRPNTPDRSNVVELAFNTWLIDESLKKKSKLYFSISALAVVLSIISTFLISAWITRPIRRIITGVDRIAQGELGYPIEQVRARSEMKILKQSITLMVSNMRAYIHRIEQQFTELEKFDKLKDDFFSNTSRELRIPLNGVIGIAETMQAEAPGRLPAKVKEDLAMLICNARRLNNLVNDVLDFSRLKYKDLELKIKPVAIKALVDMVLTFSRPLIEGKDIHLLNKISDATMVDADENRLQQILYSLFSNAIKFTHAGTVEISAKTKGKLLEVAITDTGIGVAPERIERLFDSFEQADSSPVPEHSRTSLGLSIIKKLVELHGGKIYVHSVPGRRTQVAFTLPVSKTKAPSRESASVLNSVPELALPLGHSGQNPPTSFPFSESLQEGENFNILIVDDEPRNLVLLESLLMSENYAVTRAADGEEALSAVNNNAPFTFAMVLLDIIMPKMSGFEVCRAIRQNYSRNELPIVMLTARNKVVDLVKGLQAGANDYLVKPFSTDELVTRIRCHIQVSRTSVAYSNFAPRELLRLLEKENITEVNLGDYIEKRMSVLCIRIHSFSALSEKMTPRENLNFINAYLGRITPVIRGNKGTIDKLVSNGVMALFPYSADDAMKSAIDICKRLADFNQNQKENNRETISIGIGLHTGNLILGTIGEKNYMEGAVISDAMILAKQLTELTKVYGAAIMISEETLNELEDPLCYQYRFLGKTCLKEKKHAQKIFEVMDADPQFLMEGKAALKTIFNEGIEYYYTKQFARAAEKFRHMLLGLEQDKAARFYLERCLYYSQHGTSVDWDGVERRTLSEQWTRGDKR